MKSLTYNMKREGENMSKRKILPALGLVVASIFSLTGCVNEETGNTVKDAIKEAEGMTYEELVNKAKVEIGDNKLEVFEQREVLGKDFLPSSIFL